MKPIVAAVALMLISLPAAAQSSYHQECQTIQYGKDDVRTSCTDTYTPAPKSFVPQSLHLGPGSRQDVSYARSEGAVERRPTTLNHCGAGYAYSEDNGCEIKKP